MNVNVNIDTKTLQQIADMPPQEGQATLKKLILHEENHPMKQAVPVPLKPEPVPMKTLTNALCMAYPEGEPHNIKLALPKDTNLVEAGLYQVILTRQYRNGETLMTPIVSMYYVLAQSEDDAISQVEGNAFPTEGYVSQSKMGMELIGTQANRIPVHIRGWGSTTF